VYTSDLSNPSSQTFINLKAEVEPLIQATFTEAGQDLSAGSTSIVTVTGFTQGSVIVNYVVQVTHTNSSITPTDAVNQLERAFNDIIAANNGSLPNSNIKVASLTVTQQVPATTAAPVPPEPFAEWKIAVICACILAAAAIIAAVAATCIRMHRKEDTSSVMPMKKSEKAGFANPVGNEYEELHEKTSRAGSSGSSASGDVDKMQEKV
uniref:SEA domain-containing protein n=2 Tax=Ciona intestinalis TaxID=7719 RepID=F7AMW8_CIOIN